MFVDWLPELLDETQFDNEHELIEFAYQIYLKLYVLSKPQYNGIMVNVRRVPYLGNRDQAFYHLTTSSKGETEEQRKPDIERCKRIRFPKSIIENSSDEDILVWQNKRGSRRNTLMWLKELDYLVVLKNGNGYYILTTAYIITFKHTRKKLITEYEAYIKAKVAN